jgi:hypothetical protein
MDSVDVPAIQSAELSAVASQVDRTVTVRFSGSADTRSMGALDLMLSRLHAEATRTSVEEVMIDFREFEFMNSSCFKAFVTWVNKLQETEPDKQYRVCIRSDATKHWQKRSLSALRCFAADLIRIETQ